MAKLNAPSNKLADAMFSPQKDSYSKSGLSDKDKESPKGVKQPPDKDKKPGVIINGGL